MAEQPARWEGCCAPVLDIALLLLGGREELMLLQAAVALLLASYGLCSTGITLWVCGDT